MRITFVGTLKFVLCYLGWRSEHSSSDVDWISDLSSPKAISRQNFQDVTRTNRVLLYPR